jgi:para-nitrobenzyl esterase
MKRNSRLLVLSWLIMMIVAPNAPARADPIQISGGLISGTVVGGVQTYKGIPYAKPPVGDLRWRPPQPIVPWSGTLIADEFSPICVQPDPLGGHSIFTRLFFTPIEPRSEDCLYLNVWTTAQAGDKRPVHGVDGLPARRGEAVAESFVGDCRVANTGRSCPLESVNPR